MTEPQVNSFYRQNGFEFRVDKVTPAVVFVARWKIDVLDSGRLIQVERSVWDREMVGAEVIEPKAWK